MSEGAGTLFDRLFQARDPPSPFSLLPRARRVVSCSQILVRSTHAHALDFSIVETDSLLFAVSLPPTSFSLPNNPTPSQLVSRHEPGYHFSQLASPLSTHLLHLQPSSPQDTNPIIDMETFNQLQEMDDDEDEREFSRGIIWTYFEQVPEKFDVIGENLFVPIPFCLSSTSEGS